MATFLKGSRVLRYLSDVCYFKAKSNVPCRNLYCLSSYNHDRIPNTYNVRSKLLQNIRAVSYDDFHKYTKAVTHQDFPNERSMKTKYEDAEKSIEKIDDVSIIKNINTALYNNESRLFAVIHVNGRQYKITTEDIICVPLYFDPTVGDQIRLEKVLMVGGKDFTLVGRPILSRDQVRIEATVVEKTLSHHKVNYTYRKRRRIRKFSLNRDFQTMLVINSIHVNGIDI